MKLAIVLLVITVCATNVVEGVSIRDVQARIPSVEKFYDDQMKSTKASMLSNISDMRSKLNSKAEAQKTDIRAGSKSCLAWLDLLESVQKSKINFMYQFQPCETWSSLGNVKIALFDMKRSADRVAALCSLQSASTCQSQTDLVDRGLNEIQASIERDSATRLSKSNECIQKRGADADKLMDSQRESWKTCNDRS